MYRIFLVDDEPLVIERLTNLHVFEDCGFALCGSSTSSLAALEAICHEKPEAILSDLKMPGLTGLALFAQLQRCGVQSEFIILSAFGEFAEARSFFLAGGFDYLLKPVGEQDLAALLGRLAQRLSEKAGAAPTLPISTSPELNMILAYLKERLSEKHSLDSLHQRFNLNGNYICSLFSQHLDTTFISYLTDLRMKEAGRLLRESAKSVKEIAYLCGYADYFYFCRVFREHYRCTPTSFREGAR